MVYIIYQKINYICHLLFALLFEDSCAFTLDGMKVKKKWKKTEQSEGFTGEEKEKLMPGQEK